MLELEPLTMYVMVFMVACLLGMTMPICILHWFISEDNKFCTESDKRLGPDRRDH